MYVWRFENLPMNPKSKTDPYLLLTTPPWSESSGKSKPYVLLKSKCFSTESTDTPTI
jgi:hypothetical protein